MAYKTVTSMRDCVMKRKFIENMNSFYFDKMHMLFNKNKSCVKSCQKIAFLKKNIVFPKKPIVFAKHPLFSNMCTFFIPLFWIEKLSLPQIVCWGLHYNIPCLLFCLAHTSKSDFLWWLFVLLCRYKTSVRVWIFTFILKNTFVQNHSSQFLLFYRLRLYVGSCVRRTQTPRRSYLCLTLDNTRMWRKARHTSNPYLTSSGSFFWL